MATSRMLNREYYAVNPDQGNGLNGQILVKGKGVNRAVDVLKAVVPIIDTFGSGFVVKGGLLKEREGVTHFLNFSGELIVDHENVAVGGRNGRWLEIAPAQIQTIIDLTPQEARRRVQIVDEFQEDLYFSNEITAVAFHLGASDEGQAYAESLGLASCRKHYETQYGAEFLVTCGALAMLNGYFTPIEKAREGNPTIAEAMDVFAATGALPQRAPRRNDYSAYASVPTKSSDVPF